MTLLAATMYLCSAVDVCSVAWRIPKVHGAIDHTDHFCCGADGQRVGCGPLPRRDVCRHLTGTFKLVIGRCGEQGDDQIFQCNHADVHLLVLGGIWTGHGH